MLDNFYAPGQSRQVVVISGLFAGKTDALRKALVDTGCSEIQFAPPEQLRDAIRDRNVGAIVMSKAIDERVRKRVAKLVSWASPAISVVQL